MNNPLLNFTDLPKFGLIQADHVIPALQSVLAQAREELVGLATVEQPNWQNFAAPLEAIDERIDRVWSPVNHLNSVQDSPELRAAYADAEPLLTQYHIEVGQNTELFEQYKKIQSHPSFANLNVAQQKVVNNNIRDFRLSGAELNAFDKARFAKIRQRLAELSTQFERNVLDATQAFKKHFVDATALAGLPASALAMAQQFAQEEGLEGYVLTLQIPAYLAVMQHAQERQLRKEFYLAYGSLASDQSQHPEFDNQSVLNEILSLKQQMAQILDFAHYGELSLVNKMADSVETVEQFIRDLAHHAQPVAKEELAKLKEFAQQNGLADDLQPWDISYYSERLREARFAFTDEEIKPYFSVESVFAGLFEICARLFGITVKANSTVATWHATVRYFDVLDENAHIIGGLYTDLYVRKGKRGGAWMDTCLHRRRVDGSVQIPSAYLICNFAPPIGGQPALLAHEEVETLFHEFGHTLHHLLSKVDEMSVAGINGVAWDAVELPSQFLENWCWQADSMRLISAHVETGDPLPDALLEKMRAAKNFHSGLFTLRQLELALFDIRVHTQNNAPDTPDNWVQSVLEQARKEVAIVFPPASNRLPNSFGHIFAGGYAAGYYSYKWAEVLSADAFDAFLEDGLFDRATGERFRQTILERGGVVDAAQMFVDFRGRPPRIEPLLQQSGILASKAAA